MDGVEVVIEDLGEDKEEEVEVIMVAKEETEVLGGEAMVKETEFTRRKEEKS